MQLGKLSAAMAPSASSVGLLHSTLLPRASSTRTTQRWSAASSFTAASAAAAPLSALAPVRSLHARAALAADLPSAASRSYSSSSSSSSSSASSSSSSKKLLLLGLAGAGGLLLSLTSSSPLSAEAAHQTSADAAALPLISLDAPSSSSSSSPASSSLGGAPATTPAGGALAGGKRKKKKTRRSARKLLPYPGKWSNLHRDAQGLVNVPVTPGLRVQIPVGAFPPDPHADKSVTVIPILEMGGQAGAIGQLVVQTNLGRAHKLEAYMDTNSNVSGSYKWVGDNGLSVKPSAQVSPHGNQAGVEVDYKLRESALTLSLNNHTEFTASWNQSVTPTLVAGVEFHAVPFAFVHLNGGVKLSSDNQQQQLVVSKKDSKYTASYYHQLSEFPHVLAAHGFPPLQSHVGLESSYSAASGKSDVCVALRHGRHTYNWHAALTSQPALLVAFDSELMAGAPNMRWGANAQVNYDGSGESAFGLSFMAQF